MPGAESVCDGLEGTGHTDGPGTAGGASGTHTDGPETGMRRPEHDYPEEAVPAEYRKMAADPMACLAQAAEILDHAFTSDTQERDSLAALANRWMRLAEISSRIQAQE